MQKFTIFNKNVHPLREMFKGEEMKIEAQDFWRDKNGNPRLFDVFEAAEYKGQYSPVPCDGSGKMVNDPRYFKMLDIQPVGDAVTAEVVTANKCMAQGCTHVANSAVELEAHTKKVHANADTLVLPEQDHEIKKRKSG